MPVYAAGPIDYSKTDPEERHHRLAGIASDVIEATGTVMLVYCPHCSFKPERTPRESIAMNMKALDASRLLVCEWDASRDVSIGTPIEVWRFRSRNDFAETAGIAIIGGLGDGLFAKALRDGGMVWEFTDWYEFRDWCVGRFS